MNKLLFIAPLLVVPFLTNHSYTYGNPANYPVGDFVTSQRIATLHPLIRTKVYSFIKQCKAKGYNVRITEGLRSFDRQRKLYIQSRLNNKPKVTNAKAGHSYHNYGLAFDVITYHSGCKQNINNCIYNTPPAVVTIAKSLGFSWGGDWKTFKDKPHFQYSFKSISSLRKLYSQKKFTSDGYVTLN